MLRRPHRERRGPRSQRLPTRSNGLRCPPAESMTDDPRPARLSTVPGGVAVRGGRRRARTHRGRHVHLTVAGSDIRLRVRQPPRSRRSSSRGSGSGRRPWRRRGAWEPYPRWAHLVEGGPGQALLRLPSNQRRPRLRERCRLPPGTRQGTTDGSVLARVDVTRVELGARRRPHLRPGATPVRGPEEPGHDGGDAYPPGDGAAHVGVIGGLAILLEDRGLFRSKEQCFRGSGRDTRGNGGHYVGKGDGAQCDDAYREDRDGREEAQEQGDGQVRLPFVPEVARNR